MVDEEGHAEEKDPDVDPVLKELAARNKVVLAGNPCCPGCGCLLGLKLALQSLDGYALVLSQGCIGLLPNFQPRVPMVRLGMNAAGVATGLARSLPAPILVYAGDGMTRMHFQTVAACAERNERMLYLCYNNLGYCNAGSNFVSSFASSLNAHYAATASIANVEDYVRKLRKAAQMTGFRFLEVLCPCPASSGFDASNTIEVARVAVESGFWPLYEVQNRRIEVTYKPSRLETIDRFFSMQQHFVAMKPKEKETIKNWVAGNWKMLRWV
ncbi:MAG: hypothetical protein HYY37_07100 [Candidatus Aenigmarchaeota archaeon]|nr:hypothetical protein [Candidatus Aenigmarchaeota archaeon]